MNSTSFAIGANLNATTSLHVAGNAIVTKGVSIGNSANFSSNLHISGTISVGADMVSSSGFFGDHSNVLANSSSENLSLTLPEASSVGDGRIYEVKKTSVNKKVGIVVGPYLDGRRVVILSSGNLGHLKVISVSGNWYILLISGNVEPWTPNIDATVAWFDAMDASTLWQDSGGTTTIFPGSTVGLWEDKSGSGNHVQQTTPTAEPSYNISDNLLNDFPTVGYDQSLEGLQSIPPMTIRNVYVVTYYND